MRVKLEDVCEKGSSNIKQSDVENLNGDYPVFGASGYLGNVNFYHQDKPYVAVVKDGAGIGRTTMHPANSSVIGTMQYLLPKENILPEYLYYVVSYMNLSKYYSGATIPHIYFKDYKNEKFSLDCLDKQRQIVMTLDKVQSIIEKRKKQLEKLDELVKSRFIEMFGDPVENEKGWEMIPLSELGTCKNGMNFASDEDGIEIAYLGVGDFKDNSRIDGVSGLSQISLNTMPSEEYLLKDEDIVFVRSNGSKELVGRCLAVYPGNEKLTFSGFCIRWRKNSDKVMTDFLLQVLKTENVRILMRGRGANIQNLNQQILGKLMIPVPNMALQQSFVEFVGAIDKSKLAIYKIKKNVLGRRLAT